MSLQGGYTAIMIAAAKGLGATVDQLIVEGANVNVQSTVRRQCGHGAVNVGMAGFG